MKALIYAYSSSLAQPLYENPDPFTMVKLGFKSHEREKEGTSYKKGDAGAKGDNA